MNMNIYNQVREVPKTAQKPIGAGRLKGMTDINPQWRIEKLTEMFGPCGIGWYYEVVNMWSETVGNEVCAFVNINLFVKSDGEWSKPINGIGGSKLATMEKNGQYVSDECYKMATTDALSVACKQLGFGADIYWAAGRSKYNPTVDEPKKDEPTVEDAAKAQGLTREVMIEAIKEHYPRDEAKPLLAWANRQTVEELSTAQLMTVYNQRIKK